MLTSNREEDSTSTHGFFNKTPEQAAARAAYLKIFLGGSLLAVVIIFTIFPIFYGALWKTPVRNLHGWIVDFDGGLVGQGVIQALTTPSPYSKVSWAIIPVSQFPGGVQDVSHAVLEEKTWVAITVNSGSSERLASALTTANASYDGSQAITVFGVEARNENAYRSIIVPSVQTTLAYLSRTISMQVAQRLANSTTLPSILTTSPQTIAAPVSFTIQNLAPFDQPIAVGVIFVGLIFQLIIALLVVMAGFAAREQSGLGKTLSFKSLILMRFASTFGAFFILSLLYSLLSMAFQLKYTKKFGDAGFVIFWMLNYANMLAVGLAVDSFVTILPLPALPFFIFLWIISNVSVCAFPIDILPSVYRYGYAFPFYNVSRGIRTVIFATRNRVGFTFGILIAWIAVSCFTITIFQWIKRRSVTKRRPDSVDQQAKPVETESKSE